MADFTVVEFCRFVLILFFCECGEHVLMPVVRKPNRELTWPWLKKIKSVAIFWRNRLRVAVGANARLSTLEELCPVTANAGGVVRKVRDIWKGGNCRLAFDRLPILRRYLVAGTAYLLMLFPAGMGERGL